MEALFIVPAMVSPQVNEKLIPALSKLIERNILLNNAALFKNAAMKKYSRIGSWSVNKEGVDIPVTIISDSVINEQISSMCNIGRFISEANGADKEDMWSNNSSEDVEDLKNLFRYHSSVSQGKDPNNPKMSHPNLDPRTQAQSAKIVSGIAPQLHTLGITPAQIIAGINAPAGSKANKDATEALSRLDKSNIAKNFGAARQSDVTTKKISAELKDRKTAIKKGRRAHSAELDTHRPSSFGSLDSVEQPTGIQFFNQISLEPTILEIPLYSGIENSEQKMIRVGVKCVPYIIDDVTSIIKLLNEAKNMNWFERQFKNAFRKVNTKIWFTKRRAINKGDYIDPNEASEAIMFSPTRDELTNTTTLAKKFTSKDSSSWSTMIILSSYDLDRNEALMDIVNNYRKLTKYVFGDLVITNETKESAYFCTPRLNHCQEIPFDYLKKVLNLKDVLDYSEASRASAWSKETAAKQSNIRSAVVESSNYASVYHKVNDLLTRS
jgi:hypothetical protein